MTRIFDTLTTRLFHLRAEHLKNAGHMDDLERYLRMGRDWVNEREAEMTEKFAHLFPQAYAEPVVEVPVPAVTTPEWFDRRVNGNRRELEAGAPDGDELRKVTRRSGDFMRSIQARVADAFPAFAQDYGSGFAKTVAVNGVGTTGALTTSLPLTTSLIETVAYSDGTIATGVAPLPALSPAQQDGALAFPLRGPERHLEDHGPQGGKELRIDIRRKADYEDRRNSQGTDRRITKSLVMLERRLLPVGADRRAPPACA